MNLSEIQTLIKFVSKSGVNEVELETKDFKINIKAGASKVEVAQMAMPINYQPQVMPTAPVPAAAATAQAASAAIPVEPADDDKYVTIKSPMIGTFYRSANPESPVFINVGDEIKPGDNICIIEAMKLFNEIESEVSGKIIKVLADDATPVEYDQPLFLIDPS